MSWRGRWWDRMGPADVHIPRELVLRAQALYDEGMEVELREVPSSSDRGLEASERSRRERLEAAWDEDGDRWRARVFRLLELLGGVDTSPPGTVG